MYHTLRIGLAALRLLCGAGFAQEAGPTDDARLEALLKQLGAPSFEDREKAQRELDAIPPKDKPLLERWLAKTTDEEVRTRLAERIGTMDEQLATTVPGITLNLKDANLDQLAAALQKQMGVNIRTGNAGAPAYTLDAKDQPFTEVFTKLFAQQPCWLTEQAGYFLLGNTNVESLITARGTIIGIEKAAAPRPGVGVPAAAVSFNILALVDPRIAVLSLGELVVTEVVDDKGQRWTLPPEDRVAQARRQSSRTQFSQTRQFAFSVPDNPGQRLNLRGEVRYTVAVEQKSATIENLSKRIGEPTKVGTSTVTFRGIRGEQGKTTTALHLEILPEGANAAPPLPDVELTPGGGISIRGGLSSKPGSAVIIDNEGGGGMFLGTVDNNKASFIKVTDAKGAPVATYKIGGGVAVSSLHTFTARYEEPLKMEIRTTTKTREVRVPFEFKDIVLPH